MIYVLIPAHNEAATVGVLLWKVRQLFTSFNREYQIIVVNDGSTDATDEILAPYTRALPLTLLTHRQRQGYARSLEALMREAVRRSDRPRRDLVVTMQADFSESPDDLLDLIKKLEGGADVVIADRRQRSGATKSESFARRALAAMARKRLGVGSAEDLVGTMRGYRLALLERLVKEHGDHPFLGHQGWAADLELLARVAPHARTIESVLISGERSSAARPSRLRPIVEAWRAWRAAVALKGLPRPAALAPHDAEAPQERKDHPRERSRAKSPEQHRERKGRHQRDGERKVGERQGGERKPGERQGGERQGGERQGGERLGGERKPGERQHSQRGQRQGNRHEPHRRPDRAAASTAAAPSGPGLEASDAPIPAAEGAPATPQEAGSPDEQNRRRRRRRGRGRGRGRGQAPREGGGQSQAAPPPSPPPAA